MRPWRISQVMDRGAHADLGVRLSFVVQQEDEMQFPRDVKYTKNDEWIRVEGDQGTIGITDYAQDQLSDIVFVELTLALGEQAAQGAACATIESVKAAAEVYLPVGGTVTRLNEDLPKNPEQVNREPFGAASRASCAAGSSRWASRQSSQSRCAP